MSNVNGGSPRLSVELLTLKDSSADLTDSSPIVAKDHEALDYDFPMQTLDEEPSDKSDNHPGTSKNVDESKMTPKWQLILLLELPAHGSPEYKEMGLRELHHYIIEKAELDSNHRVLPHKTRKVRSESGNHMRTPGFQSSLTLRDIRRMDFSLSPIEESAVIVRRHVILLILDSVRIVLVWDRVLVFVPDGADALISTILSQLQPVISQDANLIPFEIRVIEALHSVIASDLANVLQHIYPRITRLMASVTNNPSSLIYEDLKRRKNDVFEIGQRIRSLIRGTAAVLDDDDDLLFMNLTRLRTSPEIFLNSSADELLVYREEMETIMESFVQDLQSQLNNVDHINHNLQSAENAVLTGLDLARNRLLTVNAIIAVISMCLTLGAMISGIFGMNILNMVEDDHLAFKLVVSCIVCGISLIATIIIVLLVKFDLLVK